MLTTDRISGSGGESAASSRSCCAGMHRSCHLAACNFMRLFVAATSNSGACIQLAPTDETESITPPPIKAPFTPELL